MTNDTPAPAPPSSWARWYRIVEPFLTPAYLLAAAALLAWGAFKRFHLPQEPIVDRDIAGYLGPALAALGGKPFPHIDGRSFPYPGFVYLILRFFGDFRAISIVQHILGLIAGVLILLAWNAAGDLVPNGAIPKPLVRWMGLAPAYVYLFSASAVFFEHEIRPEAIFAFLTILNLWLSLRFVEARFVRPKSSYFWLGTLNAFVSFLIYMDKPSFGFAAVLTSLPVWLSLVLPGLALRQKGALAAAAILPTLLLLVIPEHFMKMPDKMSKTFLPETLLSAHAALIEKQMTEDLAGNGPLPFPREMVQAAHDLLGAELAKAPAIVAAQQRGMTSYKPDYLLLEYIQYGDSFCSKFPRQMNLTPQAMGDFCKTYYLRTLLHQPFGMAEKVLRQLAVFYTLKNPVYWTGRSMELSNGQYSRTADLMKFSSSLAPGNQAVERYVDSCNLLAAGNIAIPQATRFVMWLRFFCGTYLVLFAVAFLSLRLLFLPRFRGHFLWLIVALWLAYAYNFGNCLTIAVVHSLEVSRYIRIQLIYTVFAECLSLYLVLEFIAFRIREASSPRTAAPSELVPNS